MPKKRKCQDHKGRGQKSKLRAVDKIIRMKVEFNWSYKEIKTIANAMYHKEEAEAILRLVRREFSSGYCAHRLHGCAGCDEYFWMYSEKHDCPICGDSEGR